MKTGKVVISLFLLLTYVIAYAHTLLPHHPEIEADVHLNIDGKHHHHNHTQLSQSEKADANRLIPHEHHFDEGFFDLVVCLINEVEHQEDDCDIYDLTIPLTASVELMNDKSPEKARFVAVYLAVMNLSIQNKKPAIINPEFAVVYNAPPITQSPNRGPPTLV